MVILSKQEISSIAGNRFMRRNAKQWWGSFAGLVMVMVVLGALLQPEAWTGKFAAFVAVVAVLSGLWAYWWIRGMSRASKALVKECEDNPNLLYRPKGE